eukprot:SAG25_NODE_4850_length_741_cov_0.795950_1_plen_144_part_01
MVQQGAQVAYVDLRASGAAVGFVAKGSADAAAAAATTPHGAHFIQCDVSRPDEIEAAVKRALGLLGGLDVLVNNVGVHVEAGRLCHETSVWAFDQMIAVNLRRTYKRVSCRYECRNLMSLSDLAVRCPPTCPSPIVPRPPQRSP